VSALTASIYIEIQTSFPSTHLPPYRYVSIPCWLGQVIVCDEDATLDLRVRTVRYFKGLEQLHNDD